MSASNQYLASQLAYLDLDKAANALRRQNGWADNHPVKLNDALTYLRNRGESLDFFKSDGRLHDQYKEIANWEILAAVNENYKGGSGLFSCIFDTGDSRILASRGREEMSDPMHAKQDFHEGILKLINSEATKQETAMLDFMLDNKDLLGEKPWVSTGHSVGGSLADFAAVMSAYYGIDNFEGSINFDGPGHSHEFHKKYKSAIEQVGPKMIHKKASTESFLFCDFEGSRIEYLHPNKDASFLDLKSMETWVNKGGDSLEAGEIDPAKRIIAVYFSGLDRLTPIYGNGFVYAIYRIAESAAWIKEFASAPQEKLSDKEFINKVSPKIIAALATSVIKKIILAKLGLTVLKVAPVIAIVALVIFIIPLWAELSAVYFERFFKELSQQLSLVVPWLKDKATELYEAVMNVIRPICEYIKANSPGGRYANANPMIKVDIYKLRIYANRLRRVNDRLRRLDGDLRGLYWQVGWLDILDILRANLLTSQSPTLNQARHYLENTANRFETAERKIIGDLG